MNPESRYKRFHRPEALFALFAPLVALPGVGDKLAGLLKKKVGSHIVDLLRHLPVGVIDRTKRPDIPNIEHGALVTLEVLVTKHDKPPRQSRRPWRVFAENETGQIEIIFFRTKGDYVERLLPIGQKRIISGRAEWFQHKVQIAHPDHVVDPEKAGQLPIYEPVYPLTAGLTPKMIQKAMHGALERIPPLPNGLSHQF